MRTAIYEKLIAYCERCPVPDAWREIGSDVECYFGPRFGSAAMSRLLEHFTERALADAGVATVVSDGAELLPGLVDPATKLVVFRDAAARPDLIIVLSECSSDSTQSVELLRVLRRGEFCDVSSKTLFVAFTTDDAIALWAAGLIAVTTNWLLHSDRHQLEELCRQFGWVAVESLNSSDAVPCDFSDLRVLLVGWSPAIPCSDSPVGTLQAAAFLSQLERSLELDLSNVGVWQPNTRFVEDLRFDLQYSNREIVRRRLIASLHESVKSLEGYERHVFVGKRARDYAAAAADAHQIFSDEHTLGAISDRARAATSCLLELIQRDLINPMIEEAMCCQDPVTRSQLVALSNLSSMAHQQAALVDRTMATQGPESVKHRESLRDYLAIMSRLSILCREVRR